MGNSRSELISGALVTALMIGVFMAGAPGNSLGADAQGTGGGSVNTPLLGGERFIHFAFSARTKGIRDEGSFRLTIEAPSPELDVHIAVDCLNVFPLPVGVGGWIAGAVDRVTPESNTYNINPGDRLAFYVTDMGEPSTPPTELIQPVLEFGSCKLLGPFFGFTISQGNISLKP